MRMTSRGSRVSSRSTTRTAVRRRPILLHRIAWCSPVPDLRLSNSAMSKCKTPHLRRCRWGECSVPGPMATRLTERALRHRLLHLDRVPRDHFRSLRSPTCRDRRRRTRSTTAGRARSRSGDRRRREWRSWCRVRCASLIPKRESRATDDSSAALRAED
jgi:hypothetical protein